MDNKQMRKAVHKALVKHNMDIYYLSANLGLKLGIECITLKGTDDIEGMDFDEKYVPIKNSDVKYLYKEVRVELEEVHLDELSEMEVSELEKEIVMGSVYLADYRNTLGVNPDEVSAYADGYLETKDDPEEYGYYDTFYDYIQSVERID